MANARPNVFVDVNIFVDISEMRQGWNNSLEVITGIRKEKYNGYISAFTVPILYFRRIRIEPDKEACRILIKTDRRAGLVGLLRCFGLIFRPISCLIT